MKYIANDTLHDEDIISGLLEILDELLEDPFVQEYAGGNFECMYCGKMYRRNAPVLHNNGCPCLKYNDLISGIPSIIPKEAGEIK